MLLVEAAAVDASPAPAHALIRCFRQLFGNARGLLGHNAAGCEPLTFWYAIVPDHPACAWVYMGSRAEPSVPAMLVPTSGCQPQVARFQQTLQHGKPVKLNTHPGYFRPHVEWAKDDMLDMLAIRMSGLCSGILIPERTPRLSVTQPRHRMRCAPSEGQEMQAKQCITT